MSGSLGLTAGTVRLAPYDTTWPAFYVAEVARVEKNLAAHGIALSFEHTGSTAIPGMVAKPVLDLLAGRPAEVDRATTVAAIESAGYLYRGEQGIPGRDFFRRGEPRQFHLHLTLVGSVFWQDHRTFRDYLREHTDAAAEYAALKRELAERYPRDRAAYIEGKTAFVEAIPARARVSTDDSRGA
ncbi:MAG: GrpB family protein [Gemmatimonadaceae bacterium]